MSIYLCISFQSCQTDLVKDNGHKYFLSVLADPYMPVNVFLIILYSSNQTYDRNTQVQCICKFSLIYMYTVLVNPLILWGYWVIIFCLWIAQAEHRTMAAFVLAMIVNDYKNGQVSRLTQKKPCIDNLKKLDLFPKILLKKTKLLSN